ncbi:junE proto-oncogene, AP-1 transcription factor subunit [Dunckerocampus dactyliophorus]|uniref:junE proto-oncogene, AP-1 transcription factor subunit n=1 Tax=Dunckerocampus dactyliophorus TaxID=161453 RepID=UPI0024052A19|nr:junE proto-oncogene, AP-1 transcription factor subunit [Dunckerocampus dactyliophorus]XP_054613371.1 junE proto-oncogene, AP-1 transcription factor subunit [Dunckerocampus dactyliophorus]
MTTKMETPFYHDDSTAVPSFSHPAEYELYAGNKMFLTKKTMSLAGSHHFPSGGSSAAGGRATNPNNLGLNNNSSLMTSSADMNQLKLSSPDLEHLIIQSNQGLVTTSPVSTSTNPFIYRGQATNEQEGFADGFVKALADLHKQNQLVGGPMSPSSSSNVSLQASYQRNLVMSTSDMPIYTNLSSYNPGQMAYPSGQMTYKGASGHNANGTAQAHTRVLDAPQTVPEVPGDPTSPSCLSPIDLEMQEKIKAERKKLRNRIAASKCRKRKLERISRLEEKVKILKSQNSDLASTASMLREQVTQLKQKVMSHVTNGCQIAVSSAAKSGGGGSAGSKDPAC